MLLQTHVHTTQEKGSICMETKQKYLQEGFKKKHKEDKQGWKPCPAATVSSVTWWVFSFKLVRSNAPQQRYLGICHSHIKLTSAASSLTEWGASTETSQFSCLDWWGSGWRRGCEICWGNQGHQWVCFLVSTKDLHYKVSHGFSNDPISVLP